MIVIDNDTKIEAVRPVHGAEESFIPKSGLCLYYNF